MKIEDSIKKASTLGVGTKQTANASKGAEKTESTQTASVNVSVSSKMQALSSSVASSSAFDAGKVNEIKAAIADGHFQVNAEKIADGLINTVKDLIQRPRHNDEFIQRCAFCYSESGNRGCSPIDATA